MDHPTPGVSELARERQLKEASLNATLREFENDKRATEMLLAQSRAVLAGYSTPRNGSTPHLEEISPRNPGLSVDVDSSMHTATTTTTATSTTSNGGRSHVAMPRPLGSANGVDEQQSVFSQTPMPAVAAATPKAGVFTQSQQDYQTATRRTEAKFDNLEKVSSMLVSGLATRNASLELDRDLAGVEKAVLLSHMDENGTKKTGPAPLPPRRPGSSGQGFRQRVMLSQAAGAPDSWTVGRKGTMLENVARWEEMSGRSKSTALTRTSGSRSSRRSKKKHMSKRGKDLVHMHKLARLHSKQAEVLHASLSQPTPLPEGGGKLQDGTAINLMGSTARQLTAPGDSRANGPEWFYTEISKLRRQVYTLQKEKQELEQQVLRAPVLRQFEERMKQMETRLAGYLQLVSSRLPHLLKACEDLTSVDPEQIKAASSAVNREAEDSESSDDDSDSSDGDQQDQVAALAAAISKNRRQMRHRVGSVPMVKAGVSSDLDSLMARLDEQRTPRPPSTGVRSTSRTPSSTVEPPQGPLSPINSTGTQHNAPSVLGDLPAMVNFDVLVSAALSFDARCISVPVLMALLTPEMEDARRRKATLSAMIAQKRKLVRLLQGLLRKQRQKQASQLAKEYKQGSGGDVTVLGDLGADGVLGYDDVFRGGPGRVGDLGLSRVLVLYIAQCQDDIARLNQMLDGVDDLLERFDVFYDTICREAKPRTSLVASLYRTFEGQVSAMRDRLLVAEATAQETTTAFEEREHTFKQLQEAKRKLSQVEEECASMKVQRITEATQMAEARDELGARLHQRVARRKLRVAFHGWRVARVKQRSLRQMERVLVKMREDRRVHRQQKQAFSLWLHRMREKQRHRTIVGRFVRALGWRTRKGKLHWALMRWKQYCRQDRLACVSEEQRAQTMRRYLLRMAQVKVYAAFRQWTALTEAGRVADLRGKLEAENERLRARLEHNKETSAHALIKRWRQGTIVPVFQTWRKHAQERAERRRTLLLQSFRRMANSKLWQAFRQWRDGTEAARVREMKERFETDQKALQSKFRMQQKLRLLGRLDAERLRQLTHTFKHWKIHTKYNLLRKKELLKRCMDRMAAAKAVKRNAFSRWVKFMMNARFKEQVSSLIQWIGNTEE